MSKAKKSVTGRFKTIAAVTTLEKVISGAYLLIFFSQDVPKVANTHDQNWINQKWEEFLEQRGITSQMKRGYAKVFHLERPIYIPPELAEKMITLRYLP
jgi:hypothetical protein